MTDFNKTKIRDISDKLAICQYNDIELIYNKEDNFIFCS